MRPSSLTTALLSLGAGVLVSFAACGGGSDASAPPTPTAATVAITASTTGAMPSIGDTRLLTAAVRDASGAAMPDAVVHWTSSDPATLSVSPATGASTTVTSLANGTATVTAAAAPASAQTTLTVAQQYASLVLAPGTATVARTATQQLDVTARDAHGTAMVPAGTPTFSSSNTGVATVGSTGLVTGVADGSATITASLTRDGATHTATSAITVGTATVPTFPNAATVDATPSSVFTPSPVDIAAGGTVSWRFGSLAHTVSFDFSNGVPGSIGATSNATVSRTFTVPGTFTYECTIHPGMQGTVVVH